MRRTTVRHKRIHITAYVLTAFCGQVLRKGLSRARNLKGSFIKQTQDKRVSPQ